MMGIRDDLMTDDWDEARELVDLVLKRQAGPSKFGKALTSSLMAFMMDYFPHVTPGLRHRLPAHLIISQLGRLNADYPAMILPEDVYRDTRRLIPRVMFGLGMLWIRLYYTVRDGIIARIPLVGDNLMSTLHHAAEELIASWRDQYRRRPFDIAGNKAWVKKRGANEETGEGPDGVAPADLQQRGPGHRPALRGGGGPGRDRGGDPRAPGVAGEQVAGGEGPRGRVGGVRASSRGW